MPQMPQKRCGREVVAGKGDAVDEPVDLAAGRIIAAGRLCLAGKEKGEPSTVSTKIIKMTMAIEEIW